MKVAIYAYFAIDLASPTSTDQQIETCRQLIASKGWTVCEDYIRSDSGSAGTHPLLREGLHSLFAAAMLKPCPFDLLMIDEPTRLGGTHTVFDLVDRFRYLGVSLYCVAADLDTIVPLSSAEMILTHTMDEEYLATLDAKVHRSQKGSVLQGMVTDDVVKRIFDLFGSGAYTIGELARELNKDPLE